MKKIIIALVIIFLSCKGNSDSTTNTKSSADTSNVSDTGDTAPGHPGPNGYSPPNAKGGDSSTQRDSAR